MAKQKRQGKNDDFESHVKMSSHSADEEELSCERRSEVRIGVHDRFTQGRQKSCSLFELKCFSSLYCFFCFLNIPVPLYIKDRTNTIKDYKFFVNRTTLPVIVF